MTLLQTDQTYLKLNCWVTPKQERKTNGINDFVTFREGLLRSPKSSLSTAPKQAIVAFNLNLCITYKSADCQGSIPLVIITLQFISNNKLVKFRTPTEQDVCSAKCSTQLYLFGSVQLQSITWHFAGILSLRRDLNSSLSYRDVASVPSFASRDVGNRPAPLGDCTMASRGRTCLPSQPLQVQRGSLGPCNYPSTSAPEHTPKHQGGC